MALFTPLRIHKENIMNMAGAVGGGAGAGYKDDFMDWLFPNPANAGMNYLDKIPGTIKPYYDPFIKSGTSQLPGLQDIFSKLMQDPNAMIQKMGEGYKKSPGYDFRLQQGQNAVGNANAAGGMAGTLQHQQQGAQAAENMASDDYNNYMKQVMDMFGMGTQGGMNLAKMGQDSSHDLATSLGQTLMSQGQMAYGGQANRNNMTGGLINDIFGLFGGGK